MPHSQLFPPPRISVVMPTHNRARELPLTLQALATQTICGEHYELILVADGCKDNTAEVAKSSAVPFGMKVLEQPGLGAAAARNRGAAQARAPLILFLDDDMEASPDLLEAHLTAHARNPGNLVLGYFPILAEEAGNDLWAWGAKQWWDEGFAARLTPGYRFTFKDFCTGNISLPRALFESLGGFCEDFRSAGGEDWEFGARCMKMGIRFYFAKEAKSIHHGTTDIESALRRKRTEGLSHVLLVRRHPELFHSLDLQRLSRFERRPAVWAFMWRHPDAAARASSTLKTFTKLMLRLGSPGWAMRFYRLTELERYWRGVYEAVSSLEGWKQFLKLSLYQSEERLFRIDIANEWRSMDYRLDGENIQAVQLDCNGVEIGRIGPVVGSERLSGSVIREHCLAHYPQVLLGLLLDQHTRELQPGR